jgi:hypothetical protein
MKKAGAIEGTKLGNGLAIGESRGVVTSDRDFWVLRGVATSGRDLRCNVQSGQSRLGTRVSQFMWH